MSDRDGQEDRSIQPAGPLEEREARGPVKAPGPTCAHLRGKNLCAPKGIPHSFPRGKPGKDYGPK